MRTIIAVVYIFLLTPGLLLLAACRKGSRSSWITASLFLVSFASWLLLVSDLAWRGFVGFDYSARRFTTIEINLIVILALAVIAAVFARNRSRWWLVAASSILAVDWLYMGVVSSVV
jgi:hypothetical protein